MKIIENSQGPVTKKSFFSGFFSKLYYFFVFHLYAVFLIVWGVLSFAFILFIAELIFPSFVHVFNYSITDKTFTELVDDHKYHAAIDLMEVKKDLIEESDEPYVFRFRLADCYVHAGDYPKALEQYRLLREWYNREVESEKTDGLTPGQIQQYKNFNDILFLKEEFRIYFRMGDIATVRRYYGRMKTLHESTDWKNLERLLDEQVEEKLSELLGGISIGDGFRLELIQGKYLTNPAEAIAEMEDYAMSVLPSEKIDSRYKLRLFNELIRMLVEQNRRIDARLFLEFALQIVDPLEYNQTVSGCLGDLSEHCYLLNDISDGRRLLKKYLSYVDDTYDAGDIEYSVAHAMEFKYLESDGKWNELTDRVVDAGAALRAQILRNFTGMTSAQREYFIERFEPLFSYANRLLELHPSARLAEACFENNMFLKGLLLRSETSVGNAIAAMGDSVLTGKYVRYVSLSQLLVSRQYVSGPGNYYAKKKLEKEIAALETEIANASRDFRRDHDESNLSIGSLRKAMGRKDIAIQIVEGEKTVFALLLDKSGKVTYHPLASKERLAQLTRRSGVIYVDVDAVNELFGSIKPLLAGKDVYLSTSGIFNQISVGALPFDGEGRIFADAAKIHLVGSPADIPFVKTLDKINLTAKNIVLWGGVEYGSCDSVYAPISSTRGIMRGDILGGLPHTLIEVNGIAGLLRQHGAKATVIDGASATERSFTSRSRKKDYILHVSTHGFFHDSGSFTNPMQNSGLLFANSQKYWANDCLVSSINESDGILRSDEIAGLDLTGCRLVVLSACRTGLGEYNSEGVYGLQRAFKLAGVQSVLMSLWNVDDSATRELMTEFYNGLAAGKTPDDALADSQLLLRGKGYSPDRWAAFVLLN